MELAGEPNGVRERPGAPRNVVFYLLERLLADAFGKASKGRMQAHYVIDRGAESRLPAFGKPLARCERREIGTPHAVYEARFIGNCHAAGRRPEDQSQPPAPICCAPP